jgi:hypothetical protein
MKKKESKKRKNESKNDGKRGKRDKRNERRKNQPAPPPEQENPKTRNKIMNIMNREWGKNQKKNTGKIRKKHGKRGNTERGAKETKETNLEANHRGLEECAHIHISFLRRHEQKTHDNDILPNHKDPLCVLKLQLTFCLSFFSRKFICFFWRMSIIRK